MEKARVQWLLMLVMILPLSLNAQKKNSKVDRDFYEVTIFHFTKDSQATTIGNYLEKELMPALHSQQLIAGVFQPIANDTALDKKIFLIVQHASWNDINRAKNKLKAVDGNVNELFHNAPYASPAYARKELMIAEAFPMATKLMRPKLNAPLTDRIYEWRSYESATDAKFINKVKMFNEGGEVALFKRLNFNAIFYASVVAGGRMPNLIYMTSFETIEDRNAHWKTFGADAEWKKLSSLPEYQNNVSKADIILMKAMPYSDF
ncbi:MAG: NIPSNAP family protein [Bacteroidota bacterium]